MWLFQTDRESSQSSEDRRAPHSGAGQNSALERYRMYGRFYERYWAKLFAITQADMAGFETRIRESGVAMTLTDLARDVIRARLHAGPQLRSGPAPNGSMPSWVVRQWDPGASWRVGDRAIVVVASPSRGRAFAPRVGEVTHVKDDRAVIHIDGVTASQVFELGPGGYAQANEAAEAEMLGIGQRFDEDAQIDFVLWRYGSRVVDRLLHALDVDSRFVELEGLWLLRELAIRPSDAMLMQLATTMFEQNSGPMRLDDVVALLGLAGTAHVAVRFGLAQTLGERTDLFENVASVTYPRWRLAGPPPLNFTARNAVYDPETYVVLCVPGERLSLKAAQQLWRADLLQAALRESVAAAADDETEPGLGPGLRFAARESRPSIDTRMRQIARADARKGQRKGWLRRSR